MTRSIITIDGPSGSGKSTVAKLLSERLGWSYLDSGAIYRVIAYYAVSNNIDAVDTIVDIIPSLELSFNLTNNIYSVIFNGENVTKKIRSERVGEHASVLASDPKIRVALLNLQRDFKQGHNIVTDGRDMGTNIFPDANLKIYLSASIEERAARRFFELQSNGKKVDLNVVKSQLEIRDDRDKNRTSAPLIQAEDSIYIDSSNYSIDEVVDKVKKLWDNVTFLER